MVKWGTGGEEGQMRGSCLLGHHRHLPIQSPGWREDQDVKVSSQGVCHQRPDLAKEATGRAPALAPDAALYKSSGGPGTRPLRALVSWFLSQEGWTSGISVSMEQELSMVLVRTRMLTVTSSKKIILKFWRLTGVTPPTGGSCETRDRHTGGAPSVELRRMGTS